MSKQADYNKATLYALLRIVKPPKNIEKELTAKEHDIIDELFSSVKQVYGFDPVDMIETMTEQARKEENNE